MAVFFFFFLRRIFASFIARHVARASDPKSHPPYDKRTVERNIKKGLISRKDYEKHLKTLEDVGEKGAFGAADDDDDDDEPEVTVDEPAQADSHS